MGLVVVVSQAPESELYLTHKMGELRHREGSHLADSFFFA